MQNNAYEQQIEFRVRESFYNIKKLLSVANGSLAPYAASYLFILSQINVPHQKRFVNLN